MRASFIVAVVAALLAALLPAQAQKVTDAEARKFRDLFAEALVDARAEKKFEAEAKKLARKYEHAALRELLAMGPLVEKGAPKPRKAKGKKGESFETFGSVLSGLAFDFEGEPIEYDVDLPEGFKNETPVPVLIDPGHGTGAKQDQGGKAGFLGYFRNMAKQAGGADWLVVRTEIVEQLGAGGLRGGGLPEEKVLPAWDAFMRDLASRFAIDPDRVFVAGLSQTGFWSWYLGRAQPQRWAAILPMGSVTWQVNRFPDNFAHLPVYVMHGARDGVCPVEQARATVKTLQEKGYPVTYDEVADAAHEFKVWGRLGLALKKAAAKPRERFPKTIRHDFGGEHSARAYWVEASKLAKEGDGRAGSPPLARLELRVEGQEILIEKADGIDELVIGLVPELLDLDQEVVVRQGEKKLFAGKPEPDFARSVAFALRHADWTAAPVAFIALKPR